MADCNLEYFMHQMMWKMRYMFPLLESEWVCDLTNKSKGSWASLVAQLVKNLPAMQETWVRSLGWEDPLQKEMATHSSILAWRIPLTEESGRLQSMGLQELDTI